MSDRPIERLRADLATLEDLLTTHFLLLPGQAVTADGVVCNIERIADMGPMPERYVYLRPVELS